MRSVPSRRRLWIGFLVGLVAVLGSAQTVDEEPSGIPVAPEVASTRFEVTQEKTLMTAGILVYAAGELYDLYTTKRAMDAGLREGNPLLNSSNDPERTLQTAGVAKIGFAFVIGRLERRRGNRGRGAWFLSCGAVQLGLGIHNWRATNRARAATSAGPTTTFVAPAPNPPAPSNVPEPRSTPLAKGAARTSY